MDPVTKRFLELYYNSFVWAGKTTWLGVPVGKCPLDCWIFQEIIVEVQPDTIIECGTGHGGSALFFASICDLVGKGRVISIDVHPSGQPEHERIYYLVGSSTSPVMVEAVRTLAEGVVLVDLDSAHDEGYVLKELELYGPLVTPGSYVIVEDTIIDLGLVPWHGPGPKGAVEAFLAQNKNFVADRTREKFFMTWSPDGFLKRIV